MSGALSGCAGAIGAVLAEGPSDGEEFTAVTVSPGLAGFVAMFLIVVATILLMIDMSRRIRRSQARERVETRAREEQAEQGHQLRAEDSAGHGEGESDGGGASSPEGEDGAAR